LTGCAEARCESCGGLETAHAYEWRAQVRLTEVVARGPAQAAPPVAQGNHGGASFIVLAVRITESMSEQIGDRKSHGYRWLMVDDHSDLDSQRIGDFRLAVIKQRH